MTLPLPLMVPAYYSCHYYVYYLCCTCSTVPKNAELTTDKPPRQHYRGMPLATKAASFSWTYLIRAIDRTRRFKDGLGLSMWPDFYSFFIKFCSKDQHKEEIRDYVRKHQFKAAVKLFSFKTFWLNSLTDKCGILRTCHLMHLENCNIPERTFWILWTFWICH